MAHNTIRKVIDMAAFTGVKKFVWSLVVLALALIVLFFALAWLHNMFSGNIIGQFAGGVGARASGQSYSFQ